MLDITSFQTFTIKSIGYKTQEQFQSSGKLKQWAIKRGSDSEWSRLRLGDTIDARKDSIRFVRSFVRIVYFLSYLRTYLTEVKYIYAIN